VVIYQDSLPAKDGQVVYNCYIVTVWYRDCVRGTVLKLEDTVSDVSRSADPAGTHRSLCSTWPCLLLHLPHTSQPHPII